MRISLPYIVFLQPRKGDDNPETPGRRVEGFNPASKGLHDTLADGQPKPATPVRTASCLVDTVQPVKQTTQGFLGNTGSGILERQPKTIIRELVVNLQDTRGLGIPKGILQQIGKQLLQAVCVSRDGHLLGTNFPYFHT
jgi:hypothetical protein